MGRLVEENAEPNLGKIGRNNEDFPDELLGYSINGRIFAQSNQTSYVMKGSRYYKNLDFSKPVGTHRYVDNIKDRRQLAKVCLVAMARINQAEQGTITNPYELASLSMKDGRTLIQTIYEDGYVMYNDGWFIVECDEDGTLYVDVTGTATRECPEYENMEYIMDASCREAHEECLKALAEDETN